MQNPAVNPDARQKASRYRILGMGIVFCGLFAINPLIDVKAPFPSAKTAQPAKHRPTCAPGNYAHPSPSSRR